MAPCCASPRRYAVVLTTLPDDGAPFRSVAKDCKNLVRVELLSLVLVLVVELPPPNTDNRFWKLCCN